MDPSTAQLLVEQTADTLAAKLPRGFVASYEIRHEGQIVKIQTRPLRASDSLCMKQCHEDLLALFREQPPGKRLTGPTVIAALASRDQIHGESTIARSLADLVDWGYLGNRHDRAGYWLVQDDALQE